MNQFLNIHLSHLIHLFLEASLCIVDTVRAVNGYVSGISCVLNILLPVVLSMHYCAMVSY